MLSTVRILQFVCLSFLVMDAYAEEERVPGVASGLSTQLYWGDTHLHTNLSFDGYASGTTVLGPDAAYRFAKGERLMSFSGVEMQLERPLDFLVVADHASNMGVIKAAFESDETLLNSESARQWVLKAQTINQNQDLGQKLLDTYEMISNLIKSEPEGLRPVIESAWASTIDSAEQHNNPGIFTAFIGYEWTAMFNLHRVVLFKDGADKVKKVTPFTAYPASSNSDPEQLWSYLEAYETTTGGEVLAIPHNGNLSNGVLFALQNAKGDALSADYAKQRSRWEPVIEVTQIKGDSEAHPALSPSDEFAAYGKLDTRNRVPWGLSDLRQAGYMDYQGWYDKRAEENPSGEWEYQFGFARSGLKLGLAQQSKLGVNPFKFGMIGSSDAHTAMSSVEEQNFGGKFGAGSPAPKRLTGPWDSRLSPQQAGKKYNAYGWRQEAAGYAGIWAQENRRESLFSAIKRREVYASTGPRIRVRFFGGWNFQPDDAQAIDMVHRAYQRGVPMGGDLTHGPEGVSPRFLIRAVKDPDGANLDRVQVVKGWRDQKGVLHEKIYNVALSDGRKQNEQGEIAALGSTVNIETASYTNSIGDPEFAVVWRDPDFDPNALAFYYLRVLEIPTPRWTAFDAVQFSIGHVPKDIPMSIQERAYSSPIWYTPETEESL